MKRILIAILVFTSLITYGQSGSIIGKTLDKDFNDDPLPMVNIAIKGTSKGTTSDFDGGFKFENVTPGNYTLELSFVGYQTQEIPVTVTANQPTTISVSMASQAAALDEVVIKTTTKKESETALLLDQKKAVEIKQSIGAEELSRKGVSDAAAAVAKISGVSKQEGSSNVYVRGLGDRYLNTTLNGLSIPSNDIEKKNIDLNLFSSDVIENVSISKTYGAKFYGDFSAGNINIASKNYKGDGFVSATVGSGINSRAVGENFVKSEGTGFLGDYNRYNHNPFAIVLSHGVDAEAASSPVNTNVGLSFGKSFNISDESRLSIFATGTFENDFEYRAGSTVDFTTVVKKQYDVVEEYEYSTASTLMANLNYKIDSENRIKFNSIFINSSSDQVGYYGADGNGISRDAILNTDKGFYQQNIQFNQDKIFINQLLGVHKFEKIKLDWGLGYNRVFAYEPDRKRFTFENFHYALDTDPTTNPSFFSNNSFDNQRYFQTIEDEEFNGRINLAYKASEAVKINIGYNGRTKRRHFENIRYGYNFINSKQEISNVNNLNSIFNLNNLSLDGGQTGLFQTSVFRAIAPPKVGNTNRPGQLENTYNGVLNIYAGYANAEINASEKLSIVPGIRLEAFEQKINYDVINLPDTDPGFRVNTSTFFLPSINIKYALSENQNLRFSLSKTVSTPEFKEVAPFVYEGVAKRVGGNPDLLNNPAFSSIYNADFKYEWFISSKELLSFGFFAKQINDPINLVIANDATGTRRFFRTGDKAQVFGLELEVRKTLIENEDESPELTLGGNITLMHTKQDLKSSKGLFSSTLNRTDELQGASKVLLNADLSYRPIWGAFKPTANVVFSYFSDRIDALGSGQLGNSIEKSVSSLDFVFKTNITKKLELGASIKNILDPNIDFIRENTSQGDVLLSRYKKGIDFGMQLKYKF